MQHKNLPLPQTLVQFFRSFYKLLYNLVTLKISALYKVTPLQFIMPPTTFSPSILLILQEVTHDGLYTTASSGNVTHTLSQLTILYVWPHIVSCQMRYFICIPGSPTLQRIYHTSDVAMVQRALDPQLVDDQRTGRLQHRMYQSEVSTPSWHLNSAMA